MPGPYSHVYSAGGRSYVDPRSMALNDVITAVREAVSLGLLKNVEKVRAFATIPRDMDAGLEYAYEKVAASMRLNVRRSYGATVLRQRIVPSYQRQNRLAGRLAQVLSDERMTIVDRRGITFPNAELLDQEARHWRRLNFGTSESSARSRSRPEQHFSLDFSLASGFFERHAGSRGGATLAVEGRPSGPVLLGRRSGAVSVGTGNLGGLNVFGKMVTRPSKKFGMEATRGIAARHFLDAGLAAAARELPRELGLLTKEAMKSARLATRGRGFSMHDLVSVDDRT